MTTQEEKCLEQAAALVGFGVKTHCQLQVKTLPTVDSVSNAVHSVSSAVRRVYLDIYHRLLHWHDCHMRNEYISAKFLHSGPASLHAELGYKLRADYKTIVEKIKQKVMQRKRICSSHDRFIVGHMGIFLAVIDNFISRN